MLSNEKAPDYEALAEKWLNGTITAEEELIFNQWYNNAQDNPVLIDTAFATSDHDLKQRMLQKIQEYKDLRLSNRRAWIRSASIAASVILVIAAFIIIPAKRPESRRGLVSVTKNTSHEIMPGSDKAILSLADGTKISLDSSANDSLAKQGNATISKLNGRLIYQSKGNNIPGNLYNTISTPRGGQYHVVLSDGTGVWLNAASSLRFPASFSGSERVVELQGEAYFEVAKNKQRPFKLKVNNMEVAVLGTVFNVKAYDDEEEIETTLLEGSVKLGAAGKTTLLLPGQQARVTEAGQINVLHDINPEQTIAWKNGLFEFNGNIRGIMRQIARWYDVEVVYNGNLTQKAFGGAIARKENISDVLKLLEMTGTIRFKIEGKIVSVSP
jgi:ferric-dicitrate binding protein FerR (iron transport regulator)